LGADVPPGLLVGFCITAFGFVFFFSPVVIASQVRDAANGNHHCVRRTGHGVSAALLTLGLLYLLVGAALLMAGIDIICIGYTLDFHNPGCHAHGGLLGLHVRVNNNSTQDLFLLGDQKTTINNYRKNMALFGRAQYPFVHMEAGSSVNFQSNGDFLIPTGGGNAGQTFWIATGCDAAGTCAWNQDRTQGAVLEWNMKSSTLYYDISAVEAMDQWTYTMRVEGPGKNCELAAARCSFDMTKCPGPGETKYALITTKDGIKYVRSSVGSCHCARPFPWCGR
jgi:hypothetical protein